MENNIQVQLNKINTFGKIWIGLLAVQFLFSLINLIQFIEMLEDNPILLLIPILLSGGILIAGIIILRYLKKFQKWARLAIIGFGIYLVISLTADFQRSFR